MSQQKRGIASFLASIEIWLVGLMVVANIVWPVLLLVTVAVAAFFSIFRWIAFGRISLRSPGDWSISILAHLLLDGLNKIVIDSHRTRNSCF